MIRLLSAGLCLAQQAKDTSYDRAPLQELTEFRQRFRKTIDGRLCAAAFVQDDQTYTDCTDARSPDGSAGKNICQYHQILVWSLHKSYVLQEKGQKTGIIADLPYFMVKRHYVNNKILSMNLNANRPDSVRAKLRDAFEFKAAEAEKMVARLDAEALRIQDMLNRFNATCGIPHESIAARISKIESIISRSHHCMEKVEETMGKTEVIRSTIQKVETEIEKDRKAALESKENCESTKGYDENPWPDGLRGSFFNNPFFEGAPRGFRNDKEVNFHFSASGPIEGVSSQKFSILSDCGARLFLNDKTVAVDRMTESNERNAAANTIPILSFIERAKIGTGVSPPQRLEGGQKYRVLLEMVHASALLYKNVELSFLQVFWQSNIHEEEIIPRQYLFQTNPAVPLKVSGAQSNSFSLDPSKFQLSWLHEGEPAFMDASDAFIADIPQRYVGTKLIKMTRSSTVPHISIHVNVPATVYVAAPIDRPFPLKPVANSHWKVHETDDTLSIRLSPSFYTRASHSDTWRIWFIVLHEGGDIALALKHSTDRVLLFLEQISAQFDSCGGDEEVVSLVGGQNFAECSASSLESEGYGCEAGLNGKHIDKRNGIWRTKGGNGEQTMQCGNFPAYYEIKNFLGAGEYITVKFKRPVQITQFRFKPRDDPTTWPKEISLSFSEEDDEDVQTIQILHTNSLDHNTHQLFPHVVTSFVKLEIVEMFASGHDSGGSFEFIGSRCNLPHKKLLESDMQEIHIEKCHTTVERIPSLLPLQEGEQFLIICPYKCLVYPDGNIYGTNDYAPETSLCSSSIHAGICNSANMNNCKVLVTIGGPQKSFSAETRNGIQSLAHGPAESSVSLSSSHCSDDLLEKEVVEFFFSFRSKTALPLPPVSFGANYFCILLSLLDTQDILVDSGDIKQKHGGWLRPAEAESCHADGHQNPLNIGGVSFPLPSANEACRSGKDCSANFWSVSLPENGKYRLEIQLGNPCKPEKDTHSYFLQVNDVSLADGIELPKGKFYHVTPFHTMLFEQRETLEKFVGNP
ncbi:PA14 domain-containing protein [Cardiosporidium cionae]|uniref:PA14 domain-containing protein n=1 Tax=Cardiosporidium cionae TaxID=476202 RepID=A0ABQ7JGC3_9APIC|nr:PA14 domain-containing protein [Cardiosporidium cionae]|eukprot:KAF8823008.1 PA14 domain-containing protein [Cardiosporidium cionae]